MDAEIFQRNPECYGQVETAQAWYPLSLPDPRSFTVKKDPRCHDLFFGPSFAIIILFVAVMVMRRLERQRKADDKEPRVDGGRSKTNEVIAPQKGMDH